jgi:hypothetical protein
MPQFLIRDVSAEAAAAIKAQAAAAGKSVEPFLRDWIESHIDKPVISERYGYRAAGPGKAVIKRHSSHPNGTAATGEGWSQEQADAVERAKLLMQRNGPGDREQAVALLQTHFEIVVEVAP